MAGLFRHIGRVVMNNIDSEKYQMVVEGVYNGEGTVSELEQATISRSATVRSEPPSWRSGTFLRCLLKWFASMRNFSGEESERP